MSRRGKRRQQKLVFNQTTRFTPGRARAPRNFDELEFKQLDGSKAPELHREFNGTYYRWVGNLPDLKKPGGWALLKKAFPATTRAGWEGFLKDCRFGSPVPYDGTPVATLVAWGLVSAWKPVRARPVGLQIRGGSNSLFDFHWEED